VKPTRWVLAIDFGNGGAKVAGVAPSGEILATAFEPVSVHIGADGAATQDADEWEVALRSAVARVAALVDPDDLHAVGITGQWGSTVPVGHDGRPCGPVLLWSDTRAKPHVKKIVAGGPTVAGYAPAKILPWIHLTGGGPSATGSDPTGHSQLLQHELRDIGRRCRVLLEPLDYLAFRLTGRIVATPASMTLSWLTDNRIGAPLGYHPDLVRRARRDPTLLPELVPTGSVQGPLLPEAARALGLKPGVPVACGLPDAHAAVVGSGSVEPYETHVAVSTTAWLSARVPFKRTDVLHQIGTMPGLDGSTNLVANNIVTGGAALAWLREQIIAPDDGLAGGGSGIGAYGAAPAAGQPTYEALTELAARAPAGCEGLIFTPWLAGERSPVEDSTLRAAFLNLSLRTDRAMLVRAVMEGVALNVMWLMGYYEKFLRRSVPSVRMLGGGAQSDMWCSIMASTLDRPVEQVADPLNAQLRGVALWALVCIGELTLAQAAARVPVGRRFDPDPADRRVYATHFQEFRTLRGRLKGVYRRLNG
jgi:xylulokinase